MFCDGNPRKSLIESIFAKREGKKGKQKTPEHCDVIFPPFRINQIVSIFRNRFDANALRRPKISKEIDVIRKLNHHVITIGKVWLDRGTLNEFN